MSLLLYNCI